MKTSLNLKQTCCSLLAGLVLIAGSTAARAETNSSCVNYDGRHKLHGTFQGVHVGMVDFRTDDGQSLEVPAGAIFWVWTATPDPKPSQIISMTIFALVMLAANVIVRRL